MCKGGRKTPIKRELSDSAGYKNALALAPIIAGAALLNTGLDSQFSSVFDSKFGNDAGVHFSTINKLQSNFPGIDKNFLALETLCLGHSLASDLDSYNSRQATVCVLGPRGNHRRRSLPADDIHIEDGCLTNGSCQTKRLPSPPRIQKAQSDEGYSVNGKTDGSYLLNSTYQNDLDLRKRNFWAANSLTGSAPDGRPFTGEFLQQVSEGALEVVYERILQLGDNQRNHMLLEGKSSYHAYAKSSTSCIDYGLRFDLLACPVAFDIRGRTNLQQTADDIMAVVHLHIDYADANNQGRFVGVQAATVFHAQQIYRVTATDDYRAVNWNTGRGGNSNVNERAVMEECEVAEQRQRWYPGWEDPSNEGDAHILLFGRALRARGIINDTIFDGFCDPNTYPVQQRQGGDRYGFTYNTPRAQQRAGNPNTPRGQYTSRSFVQSADGHYNGNPDFSHFMNNVYNPSPRANPPYGGGDPIKV